MKYLVSVAALATTMFAIGCSKDTGATDSKPGNATSRGENSKEDIRPKSQQKPDPDFDTVGGTILIYEIRKNAAKTGMTPSELAKMILNRVDPIGLKPLTVRAVGDSRIELVLAYDRNHQEDVLALRELMSADELSGLVLIEERTVGPKGK